MLILYSNNIIIYRSNKRTIQLFKSNKLLFEYSLNKDNEFQTFELRIFTKAYVRAGKRYYMEAISDYEL